MTLRWLVIVAMWSLCTTALANQVRDDASVPAPQTPQQPPPQPPPPTQPTQPSEPPKPELLFEYPTPQQPTPPPPPTQAPPSQPQAPDAVPPPPPPDYVPPAPTLVAPPPIAPGPTAEERQRRPGFQKHDGFFFRGLLGVTTAALWEESSLGELFMGGLGASTNFAIGAAIDDNGLILHAEFMVTTILNPTIEIDDADRDHHGTLLCYAMLFGTSYYFMPINVYVTGAIGFAQATFSSSDTFNDGETGAGLAFKVGVGKEWWIDGQWAIGIGGYSVLSSLPDTDDSATLFLFGVGASVTYN